MSWGSEFYLALKNTILALQGGTKTIEDLAIYHEAVLDNTRSQLSAALLTLDGTEQTLYEFVPTATSMFTGGNIDLTAMAADDIVVIKIYKKIKSGGAYVKFAPSLTLTGVQDPAGIEIAGNRLTRYGIKITIQQTQHTTSFKTIDHEWYDAAPGV